ncbi:hypothetical protein K8I31_18005, partial [bacterium]|nr:hypothetical protein [bacterium]
MKYFALTAISLLILFSSSLVGNCQYQIVVGQSGRDVITPDDPTSTFTLPLEVRGLIQIQVDIEDRDFDISLTLRNPDGDFVAQNTGQNYPAFKGAYLLETLVDLGNYTIEVSASPEHPTSSDDVTIQFTIDSPQL